MTAEQVARLQCAAPFKPYWLQLTDGRSLYVDHPDFVSVSEEDQLIRVEEESGAIEIIDLMLVVSLRYGGNGPTAAPRT